jgi:hypothetical protein
MCKHKLDGHALTGMADTNRASSFCWHLMFPGVVVKREKISILT